MPRMCIESNTFAAIVSIWAKIHKMLVEKLFNQNVKYNLTTKCNIS